MLQPPPLPEPTPEEVIASLRQALAEERAYHVDFLNDVHVWDCDEVYEWIQQPFPDETAIIGYDCAYVPVPEPGLWVVLFAWLVLVVVARRRF